MQEVGEGNTETLNILFYEPNHRVLSRVLSVPSSLKGIWGRKDKTRQTDVIALRG